MFILVVFGFVRGAYFDALHSCFAFCDSGFDCLFCLAVLALCLYLLMLMFCGLVVL